MISYPSRRYYEAIARQSMYPVGPLERVFRLTSVLADITNHLSSELLLRGGTALNLLHLDAPRLSVDLDLDFVGCADSERARLRRPVLLNELTSIVEGAGYHVQRSRETYAMTHLVLRYTNASGRPEALKLDINFLDRVPVLEPPRLSLRHPFKNDLTEPQVLTLALEELAASKLIALERRRLARDLFDVAELAALEELDAGSVRRALVVRGSTYPPPNPTSYATTVAQDVRLVDWRSQVVALARRDRVLELSAAQASAETLLDRALDFNDGERAFVKGLDDGVLDANLLGAPSLTARIEANPGLQWRLQCGASALEER